MKKDKEKILGIYEDAKEARLFFQECIKNLQNEKLKNDFELPVVELVLPENNEDGKYIIKLVPENNDKVLNIHFDYKSTFYEPFKKVISKLLKLVPEYEWIESNENISEGCGIWQYESFPLKAFIDKDKNSYVLRIHDNNLGIDEIVGLLPREKKEEYENAISNYELISTMININGGLYKYKKNGEIKFEEYDYECDLKIEFRKVRN